MYPGMRPATGWIANTTSTPLTGILHDWLSELVGAPRSTPTSPLTGAGDC